VSTLKEEVRRWLPDVSSSALPKKGIVWAVKFRDQEGRQHFKSIGPKKKDAERVLAEAMREVHRGEFRELPNLSALAHKFGDIFFLSFMHKVLMNLTLVEFLPIALINRPIVLSTNNTSSYL